jgi:hypothetical protein
MGTTLMQIFETEITYTNNETLESANVLLDFVILSLQYRLK